MKIKDENVNNLYGYHYDFLKKESNDLKENLLKWYYKYRRKLPWRGDKPPFTTTININLKDENILKYLKYEENNKNINKENINNENDNEKNVDKNKNDNNFINNINDNINKENDNEEKVDKEKNDNNFINNMNDNINNSKIKNQKINNINNLKKIKIEHNHNNTFEKEIYKENEKNENIKYKIKNEYICKNIKNELNKTKINQISDNDLSLKGYQIYISEVMSQQTRIPTVLNYYLKWMNKWKNIFELSKSNLNDILNEWKGLGYYTRAKNVHECSKIIVNKYNGIFPNDLKLLQEIPGIGQYTSKAICIHLYNLKDMCIDTNIIRIYSRITDTINYSNALNKHCENVSKILCTDDCNCSDLSQALMDLGSSICNNTPKCFICPINNNCLIYLKEQKKKKFLDYIKHDDDCNLCVNERNVEIKKVPLVKIKKKQNKICLILLIKQNDILNKDSYLMKKNKDSNLFYMHYLFPYILLDKLKKNQIEEHFNNLLNNLNLNKTESFIFINNFTHKFSHLTYDTHIYLCTVKSNTLKKEDDLIWINLTDAKDYIQNTFCQNIIDSYKKYLNNPNIFIKKKKKKQNK